MRHSRRTKWDSCRIAILAAGMVLALLLQACASQGTTDPLEQRAQALDQELMCPICPGETIAQAQVAYAQQMRTFVREKLAEGWTDEQIKQYYLERFGPRILMTPPKQGFYLVGWVGPFIALALGAGFLAYALKRWGERREKRQGEGPRSVEELPAEYLQRIEEDLAKFN